MKNPTVIYNGKIKPHSWCRWMVGRVRNRNNSTNIRFIGDTGSGKSWSALSIAEIMANMQNYELEESDIYFSISDVIKKVHEEDPPPGTIFFIDEQQVEGSSGEFNNLRGKAYVTFFSTCRSKRYIIISTMPFADMIIKKVRRFFHVEIETLGLDTNTNECITKPRVLDYHKHKDKIYRKRLIIQQRNPNTKVSRNIKMDTWRIPKPSDAMIDIYEKKKLKFQKETYGKLVNDLERFENKNKEQENKITTTDIEALDRLTEFQKDLFDLMNNNPYMSYKDMSEAMKQKGHNCTPPKITGNIRFMRGKGIIIYRKRATRGHSTKDGWIKKNKEAPAEIT